MLLWTYVLFVVTSVGGAVLFLGYVWGGRSFSGWLIRAHIVMAAVTLAMFTLVVVVGPKPG